MDSPRRQRSISLCQLHSTTPHPSQVGVPTRLPDALGCRPSTAGGQGVTLSTFPLVPLTREPTCTQAIDPGISRSTLTPADTSRPSRSSGHFPDFPWSSWPMVHHFIANGFPIPWGCCLVFSASLSIPCPIPLCLLPAPALSQRPMDSITLGLLCGSSPTPFPAPSPCPFIPCLYPTGSPATLWRGLTGAPSFRGPLRALSTGRSLPAPVPFPCAAAPA